MSAGTFDVNADMGEGLGNWVLGDDAALMPHLSSANIAAGFHAGDPSTIRRVVALCLEHDVAIGAHPGFPDLLGFGRRRMELTPEEAADYITYQAGAVAAFARAAGAELHHVKPHGAFFALLRDEPKLAEAAAQAIAGCGDGVLLYWPAPSEGVDFCAAAIALGVTVVPEVYPDLRYAPEGRLIIEPVKQHTDLDFAAAQVQQFLTAGTVSTEDGPPAAFPGAGSFCIHGDGPNAVDVARTVRAAVEAAGRTVAAPTRSTA